MLLMKVGSWDVNRGYIYTRGDTLFCPGLLRFHPSGVHAPRLIISLEDYSNKGYGFALE